MAKKSQRTISDVVRDILSNLPETEEFISHGAPTFRVRGKIFAVYTINHHGDGRVALNLMAPRGAQSFYTKMDPEVYFKPAYLGPKGWLGIQLDKGLAWKTISEHTQEAYAMVAPPALVAAIDKHFRVKAPTRKFRQEEIDPFKGKRAKNVLKRLDAVCESLPETEPGVQFGNPIWKAGKKTFVSTHYYTGRMTLSFWVGAKRQTELKRDHRYRISPYTGHNGWIDLDVEDHADWDEIEQLLLESYRHFALKRMLKALP